MKPKLSEAHVAKIMQHLLERFGEPIGDAEGDGQGVPSVGGRKEDMGNRGFGAETCNQCGGMMGMDECCTACGQMPASMEQPAAPIAPVDRGTPEASIVVVKGGPKGGDPTPAAGNASKGKVASGVHPPQGMDGIPETGSGRGVTTSKSKAAVAPAAAVTPAPMSTDMDDSGEEEVLGEDDLDEESIEDKQEELHYDIDHDGERGEPKSHREKVLGHDDDMDEGEEMKLDLDEDDAPPPPSGGSSPPPSGGSTPKPPPPPPPSGGSSPPPTGGSSPSPASNQSPMEEDMELDEVTHPGREKQVRALKKKGDVDNPWAVAWSSYNKSHKKK